MNMKWRFPFALLRWGGFIWLPGYLKSNRSLVKERLRNEQELHIILFIVDHFEPSRKEGEKAVRRVHDWCKHYEKIATSHFDSGGIFPQHTWFYRSDYKNDDCIRILSENVYKDLGEIEFHLHHGYDTPSSFRQKLRDGMDWFNEAGAMISAEQKPRKYFGYVAGNWALDNSRRNAAMSGVNTELSILGSEGCYADFTFPAFNTIAQPRKVNCIYYSKDTPKPKSYNTGIDVEVGRIPSGDLMIFQGPLYIDWKRTFLEYAALESFAPYLPCRIKYWVNAGIHVVGRPEWVFVKLHTHGMQSRHVFLGEQLDRMFTDLENKYTKPPFFLHYVTAREAYNIVKAAEAGMKGDPMSFRDFAIPKPANRKMFCNQPYQLQTYSKNHIIVNIKRLSSDTIIEFKELPVRSIKGGKIKRLEMVHSVDSIEHLQVDGNGKCTVSYKERQNGNPIKTSQAFDMPFRQ